MRLACIPLAVLVLALSAAACWADAPLGTTGKVLRVEKADRNIEKSPVIGYLYLEGETLPIVITIKTKICEGDETDLVGRGLGSLKKGAPVCVYASGKDGLSLTGEKIIVNPK